jgi:hypothetical protein
MKVGETVKLCHVQGAVNRTKNRIRENGPSFVVISEPRTVRFAGGMWIRFESVAQRASDGNGGKEAWHGWLPVKEIEVIA